MTPDDLFRDFSAGFAGRKFTAGLLVAMIDFLSELGAPALGLASFEQLLERFPRVAVNPAGKRFNTLVVTREDGRTLSLRGFYNEAERFYRAGHKRFDYPSAAPHATQAWPDYLHWLDALAGFSTGELATLRARVDAFVLEKLPSQAFDPALAQTDPPLFRLLLENFDMAAREGEPTGAAFQGLVFGFLRADNPHLQIEIDKARTGSKRLQRIGDVDGWEGGRLAITAEVKQYQLKEADIADLAGFSAAAAQRGALALVAALGFLPGAREAVRALPAIPLEVADLLRIVELWDPFKQRVAVQSFVYYARHVEKSYALAARVDAFLEAAAEDWRKGRAAPGRAQGELF